MIRLASTVMMLRPSDGSFEVFMLRRSAASAFAPDVYVFPGGTLDGGDYTQAPLARVGGLDEGRMSGMFRTVPTPLLHEADAGRATVPQARALVLAALRETFEEAGVLLGLQKPSDPDPGRLRAARLKLLDGELTFAQVLDTCDLTLDASALELFSQWITPPGEGRRFNAHFFVAQADAQHAVADRAETHDERWITPKDALARCASGAHAMIYPTIKHIERLCGFTSVHDVMAFAKRKQIVRIMPHSTTEQGFSLPPELEHAW